MIYITGDKHRDFYRLHSIEKNNDNMVIILGDAGINYCLNEEDSKFKNYLKYNVYINQSIHLGFMISYLFVFKLEGIVLV